MHIKAIFTLGILSAFHWLFDEVRISKILILVLIGMLGWTYHENQNLRENLIFERTSGQHREDIVRAYANALRYELQRSERLETAILPVSNENLTTH